MRWLYLTGFSSGEGSEAVVWSDKPADMKDEELEEIYSKEEYERLKGVCDWLQGYVEGAIDTHYWSMKKQYLVKDEIEKFRNQVAKLKGVI